MNPTSRRASSTALKASTSTQNPEVKRIQLRRHGRRRYDEFKGLFSDQPDWSCSSSSTNRSPPDVVPGRAPSTRRRVDQRARRTSTRSRPGVTEVVSATETIRSMQRITGIINVGLTIAAIALLHRVRAAHPQHDPHGHVRPAPRDRGHEAGRRDQLVHPGAVHAGGPGPGPRRLGARDRGDVRSEPVLRDPAPDRGRRGTPVGLRDHELRPLAWRA